MNNSNIFAILIAISSFNLCKNLKIKSKTINYISSLTMFIYIIHDNILFRTYIRQYIVVFIKDNFGYNHIILYALIASILLFIVASILSAFYKETIQRATRKITNKLYNPLRDKCNKSLDFIMKLWK